MIELLIKQNSREFYITDTFESRLLVPVIKNTLYKAENCWDDYDEVYHCCHLIETVRRNPAMTMDFHFFKQRGQNTGLALVTHGQIETDLFFPPPFHFSEPASRVLVFNYFHISPEGRGTGEMWLRDIILPHYKAKEFQALYVKSTHPKVWTLYGRLGKNIGSYTSQSDNGLFEREGAIFRIPLA